LRPLHFVVTTAQFLIPRPRALLLAPLPLHSMNFDEAFYVHVQGEQKGPYTLRHLDHLLNSGLIPAETLYWAEGMEQWLPVTQLVPLRHKPRNWKKLIVLGAVLVVLAAFLAFFGPTIADGWRERTQRQYNESGAYWSARGAVRSDGVPTGSVVQFDSIDSTQVLLDQKNGANVRLGGILIGGAKDSTRMTWSAKMAFNPLRSEWSATEVQVVPE